MSDPAPQPSPDLASLSASDRAAWRLTGEWPSAPNTSEAVAPADASTPSTEADSSSAAPDAQAAATAATPTPASEPGTPKKANAETRKAELKTEIETLLKERDTLRREMAETRSQPRATLDAKPAASSPAAPPPLATLVQSPDLSRPPLSDVEFYTAYPEASVADFTRYVARYEFGKASAESQQTQQKRARLDTFQQAVTAASAADPEFWPAVSTVAQQLVPIDHLDPGMAPTALNYAAQEIVESAHGPALLKHLAAHPELMATLRQSTPVQAIRHLAQLDWQLAHPASSVSPVTPVVKTTTSAPAPGSALGTRQTAPADEAQAAVVAGDFGRYRSTMNRREGAAS
jgi:hypothetical protein